MGPECAIISHGNAKFGRSKDAHPNKEVIDLLRKKNVYIFLTNDIVKDGKTILTCGRKSPYGLIEIRNP
jgi:beta-lactamase superfamily II metal-dependent hydrolase